MSGVVTRIMDFGAFVELAEGVEGLVHISQLSDKRVETVKSVVSEGMTVTARVREVDEERRRIGLTMRKEVAATEEAEGTLADLDAINAKHESKKRKKPLKDGVGQGAVQTQFGELRLG